MDSASASLKIGATSKPNHSDMQGPRGALAHLRVALCNPLRAHNQGSGLATEPFVRPRVPQSLSEEDLMRGMVMGLSTLAMVALRAVGLADGDVLSAVLVAKRQGRR